MGKGDQDKENKENLSLNTNRQHHLQSHCLQSSNHDPDIMKTRSGREPTGGTDTNTSQPASQEAFSASVLMQNIASSVSAEITCTDSTDIAVTTTAGDRSPLSASAQNEQTPEKSTDQEPLICLVPIDSEATPTTNLKILCDAANDSFSPAEITIEDGGRVRAEPVTPTANLKMLITAASPEIRSLEMSKSRLFEEEEDDDQEGEDKGEDDSQETSKKKSGKGPPVARKAKSLGILCRRFMAQFEEYPPPTSRIEVCLDELAAHLGTERRRIYDIVNVLESVELMSRRAKNRYLWHGKTNLNATLVKLKYYADTEQIAKQLELVRELELARLYGRKSKSNGFMQTEEEAVLSHPKYQEYVDMFGDGHKKERSLGVMSQKFLMLFLTGKTKTINLDMAAKLLLGDPKVETKRTNSVFKTKIRRLYDIANILASLNLICKVHVTELRGRKPAFSYIGPNVEELAALDEYQYLKNVEVCRPGRATLDMKMEELKKKMEAHMASDAESGVVKQVPPVTLQGPELEKAREGLSTSNANLSQLATELVAKNKSTEQEIQPKSPTAENRPFVVIQGPGQIVTTSKAPVFMEGPAVASVPAVVSTQGSTDPQLAQIGGVTLVPITSLVETAQQFSIAQSPPAVLHKLAPAVPTSKPASPAPSTAVSGGERPIRPSTTTTTKQRKRSITTVTSATASPTSGSEQSSSSYSMFFLTKNENEYFLINKKAKTDDADDSQSDTQSSQGTPYSASTGLILVPATSLDGVEQQICTVDEESGQLQLVQTPISTHVPLVYSTPSTVRPLNNSGTTGQITIIASPTVTPISTPNATPVDSHTSNSNVVVKPTGQSQTQQPIAIRKLNLK